MDKLGDTLSRQAGAWNPTLSPANPHEDTAAAPQTRLIGQNEKDAPCGLSELDRTRQQAGQVLQEHTRRGSLLASQVGLTGPASALAQKTERLAVLLFVSTAYLSL